MAILFEKEPALVNIARDELDPRESNVTRGKCGVKFERGELTCTYVRESIIYTRPQCEERVATLL